MTARDLEPMDITKSCISFLKMLCWDFAAAIFSCCLFVLLSAFSLV